MKTLNDKLYPLLDKYTFKNQDELEKKIEEIYNSEIIKGSKYYFGECLFFTDLSFDYIESRKLNIPVFLSF